MVEVRDWSVSSLSAVSNKPQYGVIASGKDIPDGPLLIRQTDIKSGTIDWSTAPRCELSGEKIAKYMLKRGDILVSRLGSIGNVATVKENRSDAVFAGYLIRFRIKTTLANPFFVGYLLQSPSWKNHVRNVHSGAVQPTLNAKQMGEFRFALPPLAEQRAIAATLGALDDKIESNKKAHSLIEEICWVKFSSLLSAKQTATGTVGSLGKIVGGGTPLKSNASFYQKGGIPWVTPKDLSIQNQKFISKGALDISESGYRASSAKIMPAGSVLFSSRAPIGYMAIAVNDISTNQGFKSVVPNSEMGTPFTYLSLRNALPTIQAHAGGSTFKEISAKGMKNIPIPLLDPHQIQMFNSWCEDMFDRQMSMQNENLTLAALRDTLLPELMSGRIRVPEAWEVVQEATDTELPGVENG